MVLLALWSLIVQVGAGRRREAGRTWMRPHRVGMWSCRALSLREVILLRLFIVLSLSEGSVMLFILTFLGS